MNWIEWLNFVLLVGGLAMVAVMAPWPITLAAAAGAWWLWRRC